MSFFNRSRIFYQLVATRTLIPYGGWNSKYDLVASNTRLNFFSLLYKLTKATRITHPRPTMLLQKSLRGRILSLPPVLIFFLLTSAIEIGADNRINTDRHFLRRERFFVWIGDHERQYSSEEEKEQKYRVWLKNDSKCLSVILRLAVFLTNRNLQNEHPLYIWTESLERWKRFDSIYYPNFTTELEYHCYFTFTQCPYSGIPSIIFLSHSFSIFFKTL